MTYTNFPRRLSGTSYLARLSGGIIVSFCYNLHMQDQLPTTDSPDTLLTTKYPEPGAVGTEIIPPKPKHSFKQRRALLFAVLFAVIGTAAGAGVLAYYLGH